MLSNELLGFVSAPINFTVFLGLFGRIAQEFDNDDEIFNALETLINNESTSDKNILKNLLIQGSLSADGRIDQIQVKILNKI